MARKHRILRWNAGELNLTAMIDVAFQMLAFFIVTVQPVDVLTNIDACRPSPAPEPSPPAMIRITVAESGYALNEQPMDFKEMETLMTRLAQRGSRDRNVLILCDSKSIHAQLVRVLDLCAKLEMKNLAVTSSN